MGRSSRPLRKREDFMKAVAISFREDRTKEQVAADLGISVRTLETWKTRPEWQEELDRLREQVQRQVDHIPIAQKANRIKDLQRLRDLMWSVVEDRQLKALAWTEVEKLPDGEYVTRTGPGVESGLVVRRPKTVKGQLVYEYRTDTALTRELRDVYRQVAEEMGQLGADEAQQRNDGRGHFEMEELLADYRRITLKIKGSNGCPQPPASLPSGSQTIEQSETS